MIEPTDSLEIAVIVDNVTDNLSMVLSHGHWDHAAAMPRALQMITLANGGKPVPTYMHPEMFASRAVKNPQRRMMPMEDIPSQQVLAGNGAELIITRDEQSVLR
jgi:7,8-dihydropterin-6-yl-methyl-4-(beta-D-ribofuranosyl)aminobenzene 5'-phosphate synthase